MRRQPIATMTSDEMHAEIRENLRKADRNIDYAITLLSLTFWFGMIAVLLTVFR